MEEKFRQQIKKGVLDMIVLRLVAEKPTYGYEIIQELEQRGKDFFQLKEGTLYPVLYRLEDGGLIRSEWKLQEGRNTPKKYYMATDQGREVFQEYRSVWEQFVQTVNEICGEETE